MLYCGKFHLYLFSFNRMYFMECRCIPSSCVRLCVVAGMLKAFCYRPRDSLDLL